MTRLRGKGERGATMLEFTLVGIGMIFVFLSFFEIARGMWTYQTLAYAVREGARYSSVHGKDCDPLASSGNCLVTVSQIATVVLQAGPGLDPDNTTMTLTAANGTDTTGTITNLRTGGYATTNWPPTNSYATGQLVKISATYPFRTFLAMFWVGGQAANYSKVFTLGASSTEPIQF